MLPVVHGREYTLRCIFAYTLGLSAVTLMPFAIGMSGWILPRRGAGARRHLHRPRLAPLRRYSDRAAQASFRWSITYLFLLFAALLADHYLA
jgi:protoheme IX farnesyltransferase